MGQIHFEIYVTLVNKWEREEPDPFQRCTMTGYILEHVKFQLDIRKTFFTMRLIKNWKRLPSKVVESPALEILKKWTGHLVKTMSNLL